MKSQIRFGEERNLRAFEIIVKELTRLGRVFRRILCVSCDNRERRLVSLGFEFRVSGPT